MSTWGATFPPFHVARRGKEKMGVIFMQLYLNVTTVTTTRTVSTSAGAVIPG